MTMRRQERFVRFDEQAAIDAAPPSVGPQDQDDERAPDEDEEDQEPSRSAATTRSVPRTPQPTRTQEPMPPLAEPEEPPTPEPLPEIQAERDVRERVRTPRTPVQELEESTSLTPTEASRRLRDFPTPGGHRPRIVDDGEPVDLPERDVEREAFIAGLDPSSARAAVRERATAIRERRQTVREARVAAVNAAIADAVGEEAASVPERSQREVTRAQRAMERLREEGFVLPAAPAGGREGIQEIDVTAALANGVPAADLRLLVGAEPVREAQQRIREQRERGVFAGPGAFTPQARRSLLDFREELQEQLRVLESGRRPELTAGGQVASNLRERIRAIDTLLEQGGAPVTERLVDLSRDLQERREELERVERELAIAQEQGFTAPSPLRQQQRIVRREMRDLERAIRAEQRRIARDPSVAFREGGEFTPRDMRQLGRFIAENAVLAVAGGAVLAGVGRGARAIVTPIQRVGRATGRRVIAAVDDVALGRRAVIPGPRQVSPRVRAFLTEERGALQVAELPDLRSLFDRINRARIRRNADELLEAANRSNNERLARLARESAEQAQQNFNQTQALIRQRARASELPPERPLTQPLTEPPSPRPPVGPRRPDTQPERPPITERSRREAEEWTRELAERARRARERTEALATERQRLVSAGASPALINSVDALFRDEARHLLLLRTGQRLAANPNFPVVRQGEARPREVPAEPELEPLPAIEIRQAEPARPAVEIEPVAPPGPPVEAGPPVEIEPVAPPAPVGAPVEVPGEETRPAPATRPESPPARPVGLATATGAGFPREGTGEGRPAGVPERRSTEGERSGRRRSGRAVRFELPSGRSLQPDQVRRFARWSQGQTEVTLDLRTGEHRFGDASSPGSPRDTFRLVGPRASRLPRDQSLRLGMFDVNVSPEGISFEQFPARQSLDERRRQRRAIAQRRLRDQTLRERRIGSRP